MIVVLSAYGFTIGSTINLTLAARYDPVRVRGCRLRPRSFRATPIPPPAAFDQLVQGVQVHKPGAGDFHENAQVLSLRDPFIEGGLLKRETGKLIDFRQPHQALLHVVILSFRSRENGLDAHSCCVKAVVCHSLSNVND
jgi:hypothetical protein